MAVILSFVWGGLFFAIRLAMRKESAKSED
jgi:hypothetical protein